MEKDMTAKLRCARVVRGLGVIAATTALLAGCGGSAIDETAAGPGTAVTDEAGTAAGAQQVVTTGAVDVPAAGVGSAAAANGAGAPGTAAKATAAAGPRAAKGTGTATGTGTTTSAGKAAA